MTATDLRDRAAARVEIHTDERRRALYALALRDYRRACEALDRDTKGVR